MFFQQWVRRGGRLDASHGDHHTEPWYKVIWLTGVDYFSTLGYQPGIALLAAGALSPIATAVLIFVTLFCALPVYRQVAQRSFVGQGSIAMLENLLSGWWGKVFVLMLLGFAATDFVITMTLSAADAAQHAVENPILRHVIGEHQMGVTLLLLIALAAVFLAGFSEAIGLAMVAAIPYLILSAVVLVRAGLEVVHHPELFSNWQRALELKGNWWQITGAAMILFPRLALGLSGFETGVSVMPLVASRTGVAGRVANTRKLLAVAALIMSVYLIASSFTTAVLIPPEAYREGGEASGRAIAYLAHHLLGNVFGTIYDFSTIAILWFAGASAMAGLMHIVPRYLPRMGLAPAWVAYSRPLVLGILVIDIIITLIFKANVEAQGGAYATGVLVLMFSAAFASSLALWREGKRLAGFYTWVITVIFAYTLAVNVVERPDGLIIASIFILAIVVSSAISRYQRATELRVSAVGFADEESREIWKTMVGKKVNLVPIRGHDPTFRKTKEHEIRRYYKVDGPLAFVHVHLIDNRSEFFGPIKVKIEREGKCFVIEVFQAVAIANTLAVISELLDPISIFLGLSRLPLMTQAFRYFLLGEGETGMMVYTILLKYWESTPEEDVRPLIFLMSD
jgi:hypothetical protein